MSNRGQGAEKKVQRLSQKAPVKREGRNSTSYWKIILLVKTCSSLQINSGSFQTQKNIRVWDISVQMVMAKRY